MPTSLLPFSQEYRPSWPLHLYLHHIPLLNRLWIYQSQGLRMQSASWEKCRIGRKSLKTTWKPLTGPGMALLGTPSSVLWPQMGNIYIILNYALFKMYLFLLYCTSALHKVARIRIVFEFYCCLGGILTQTGLETKSEDKSPQWEHRWKRKPYWVSNCFP